MPLLRLENIHKTFNGTHALRGIDLEVERGETVAIIGPSGCGKTTLLRCAALLDEIDEGKIHLAGRPVSMALTGKRPETYTDQNQYHARVGMVFQNLNVWPHLSVMANLTLAPELVLDLSKRDAAERARHLLDRMDIADKAIRHPHELSGGELQRVALARALMMEPEVLLLDEITSALDPELVGEVLDVIADLTRGGMTMLIVTHEMRFAEEVSDRVLFIDEGALVEQGPACKLLKSPTTERLQLFLRRISLHRIPEGTK